MMLMTLALFAGCNNSQDQENDVNSTSGQTEKTTENADESWNYIKEKGTLIVGLDDTFCPMGFHDENGNLVGFDIDLAEALGEQIGIKVEFQSIDWDAKEMELSNKKIDCIWNGMSQTPERVKEMTLSKGYLKNKILIMTTADATVDTLDDLKNYQIGIQAKSAALEVLQDNDIYKEIEGNVYEYATYDEVIMDMDAGRLQVMIVDQVLGEYKNSKRSEDKKFKLAGTDLGEDLYVIGMRKNETALCEQINGALDALKDSGKADEFCQKWFNKNLLAY